MLFFSLSFWSSFLSGRAEWVSWACQRMASEGKRNPVCKSHHRDVAAVRRLCLLCFTTRCLILLTRQGSGVHRWCNDTVEKCTKTHRKPPSRAPGADVQEGKRGDALHLPCMTPHPLVHLSITHDSFISVAHEEAEGQCVRGDRKQVWTWHRSSPSNKSCWTSDQVKELHMTRLCALKRLTRTRTVTHTAHANGGSSYMRVFDWELKARYSWLHFRKRGKGS